MENREYYTPEISDLFVGYKCQRRVIKPNYVEKYLYEWRDYTVDEHYFSVGYEEGQDWNYDEVELRTPYLGKQNIIDLGWEHKQYVKDSEIVFNFVKDDWYLEYWVGKIPYVEIGREGYDTGYAGNCKSKNELLKLMRDYLNIPI